MCCRVQKRSTGARTPSTIAHIYINTHVTGALTNNSPRFPAPNPSWEQEKKKRERQAKAVQREKRAILLAQHLPPLFRRETTDKSEQYRALSQAVAQTDEPYAPVR